MDSPDLRFDPAIGAYEVASEASDIFRGGTVTGRMSGSGHIQEINYAPEAPIPANPTDAVAEAARRVHYAAANEIEQAALVLAESSNVLVSDSKMYAEQLRREGDRILSEIKSKTSHVQAASADIRSRLDGTQVPATQES